MKYIVATFHVVCAETEFPAACALLVDTAAEAGFESFEDCDGGVKAYAQQRLWDKNKLDEGLRAFLMPDVSISYDIENMEDRDWNEEWENAGFEPINIGDRCVIYDARHTDRAAVAPSDRMDVFIEARQSFGSGTHQTTQMVIAELLKMPLRGCNVLDCGCGTGILGIVASMLGAGQVAAYDVDEWCVENTRHNASLNGRDNIVVKEGDAEVLKTFGMAFDVVVANINRNIILADIHAINEVMKDGARLIMSGFYADDVNVIIGAAQRLGMAKMAVTTNEDWACVVVKKP